MSATTVARTIEKTGNLGNAAANIEVPAGVSWEIVLFEITLVTSADVANRLMTVAFRNALNAMLYTPRNGIAHAASLTKNYMYAPGLPDDSGFIDTVNWRGPIPGKFTLASGSDINVVITAGVVADVFSYRLAVLETASNV